MKSNAKSIIIITITLGIFFALVPMNAVNPGFIPGNSDEINLDKENLKPSAVSGKILIDGNSGWAAFRAAGKCTGNGTYSEPYIIEDLEIDGEGSEYCIYIKGSDVYFRIENCTLYNSEGTPEAKSGGILLVNVDNSQLSNNNCSSNVIGLNLFLSYNNTISENIVNYNSWSGMRLVSSDDNIISGNTANNNKNFGICSFYSECTNISTNVCKNNNLVGIYSSVCINNTISGNTVSNNGDGIFIHIDTYDNVLGNDVHNNSGSGLFIRLDNSIISGNNASYNGVNGINLEWTENNTISGNIANYNHVGIRLEEANNNIISGNTLIGNDKCIVEEGCKGNVFKDNYGCIYPKPTLNYFPIILIISSIIIGVSVFIINKNRKRFRKPQQDVDFL